jgi:hypothetical protein
MQGRCDDVVFNNAYWQLRVHRRHQPWNGCIEYSGVALKGQGSQGAYILEQGAIWTDFLGQGAVPL